MFRGPSIAQLPEKYKPGRREFPAARLIYSILRPVLPHLLQRPVLGLARLIFGNGLQGPDLKDPLREVHLFAEILRRRPGHGGIGAVVKDPEEVIPPHAGKARVREAGGKQPLHLSRPTRLP